MQQGDWLECRGPAWYQFKLDVSKLDETPITEDMIAGLKETAATQSSELGKATPTGRDLDHLGMTTRLLLVDIINNLAFGLSYLLGGGKQLFVSQAPGTKGCFMLVEAIIKLQRAVRAVLQSFN